MVTQVIDQTPRVQFVAAAAQTIFAYPFQIFVKTDITVDVNGTNLVVDVGFTVSDVGNINGGNVTLTAGSTAGDIVTIFRSQGFDRETDYQESGDFLSGTVNDDMNRMILMDQQNREELSRSLQYPIDDIVSSNLLPILSSRTGQFLGFDSNGDPVALASPGTQLLPDGTIRTFVNLSTQSAALSHPGIATGFMIESNFYDLNLTVDSNALHAFTGTTIGGKSGNWPDADGFFYDADGKQFRVVGNPVNVKSWGAVGVGPVDDTIALQTVFDHFTSGTSGINPVNGGPVPEIHIPGGVYGISAKLTIPNTMHVSGAGRWSTTIRALPGFTGIMMQDKGNASKIIIEYLQIDAKDEAGVTDLLNLGLTIQFGTAGLLKSLLLRGGDTVTNTGTTGLRHSSNVVSILDVHTLFTEAGIIEAANSTVVWYDDISLLGCNTFGLKTNGSVAIGKLELEAPGTNCVGLFANRQTTIDHLTYSQALNITNAFAIEIDTDCPAFSIQQFDHFQKSGSILTNVIKDNRPAFATNWAEEGNALKRIVNGSDSLSSGSGFVELRGNQLQNFVLRITTTGGNLQHRIASAASGAILGKFSNKINNASVTLVNTPTGADASTAFVNGGKVSSVATHRFIFDVAAQNDIEFSFVTANIAINRTGLALNVNVDMVSRDIDGVTQVRLEIGFTDAATGANRPITVANFPDLVDIAIFCTLR